MKSFYSLTSVRIKRKAADQMSAASLMSYVVFVRTLLSSMQVGNWSKTSRPSQSMIKSKVSLQDVCYSVKNLSRTCQ